MLQLYGLNKTKLHGLINYKDLKVERTLDGDEVLSFSYPQNDGKYSNIKEECYIRTKDNEYVIKEVNIDDDWTEFVCKINVENLKGNAIERFESVEQTIESCLNLALVGTGWSIGSCNIIKKRTIRKANSSAWDILQECRKVYRCDYRFDVINRKIYIYQSMGNDRGTYFTEELNLKKLGVQSNSYDYCTRIIPIGKDGLKITSINSGKEYVENYQYSNKVITVYWEDNRYTNVQSLKEDAAERLDELSKPRRAYSADIIDLAKLNDKYKNILDYDLGDTITLLSKDKKVKDKQRIVKIVEYPDEPEKNTCEIANRVASLEDLQTEFIETAEIVETVTTSDGQLDGTKVDGLDASKVENLEAEIIKVVNLDAVNAEIDNLKADKADIQELNTVKARVGELEATSTTITELNAVKADINELIAKKANVEDLNAINADIEDLSAKTAKIEDLEATNTRVRTIEGDTAKFKSVFSEVLEAGQIVAGQSIIAKGAIGDVHISDLSADKLKAGTVDTTSVTVQGTNGRLKIKDNRLQVFDEDSEHLLYERVALGDINADGSEYGFLVRGKDGTTILINQDGITKMGFTDGYNKVDDGSLDGKKLDIATVITAINNGTTTINSSKVFMDDKTLDVAFSEIQQAQTEQGDSISNHSSQISALSDEIALKVSQTDLNEINDTLTEYDVKITGLTTKADGVIIDVNDIKTRVEGNETNIENISTYFAFNTDGLTIRKNGSPFNITISNKQMSFIDNGNEVAYVNGQKMYIDSLEVLTSLVVGNHKIEKYNNNEMTLIKWVG